MRNPFDKISAAGRRLLAAASVGAVVAPAAASAQGVGTMAQTVNGQISSLGTLLLGGSFLGGVGLCGAGLMKLKAAADSQGREPYGPGLWRLGVGGGLVALPTFSATFRDTFTGGNNGTVAVGNATFSN
jgi:hypothetical protein